MDTLVLFIYIIHILAAICIVALVLVQQGKGATVGAAFGSGASQTMFGSRGSGSFLFKMTIVLALVFFGTSIALNHIATTRSKQAQSVDLPFNLPTMPAETPRDPAAVTPNNIPGVAPSNVTIPSQPNNKNK